MLHQMLNNKHKQMKSSGSCLGRTEAGTANSALQAEKQHFTVETTDHNGPNAYRGSRLSNRKQSALEILPLQQLTHLLFNLTVMQYNTAKYAKLRLRNIYVNAQAIHNMGVKEDFIVMSAPLMQLHENTTQTATQTDMKELNCQMKWPPGCGQKDIRNIARLVALILQLCRIVVSKLYIYST